MPSSKPKHTAVAGRVRISLFARAGAKPTDFVLERRRNDATEDWYPAAGFQIDELDSLEQAAKAVKEHLANPNGKPPGKPSSAKGAESDTPPPPPPQEAAPAPPTQSEEPPFTPNRPQSQAPVPGRNAHRTTRPHHKAKPSTRPSLAKAKGRSR